ncbi:MAG TPA: DsbA family protein, partial [Solirubrobacteraceae bacterium]|nr:DsbA family protein [Solirubrobacteraceae bacterium]
LTLALYRTAFVEGRALNDPDAVADAVQECGLEPDAVLDAVERPEIKEQLRAATEEAQERGVTGVPTVAVDNDLFWGDDRLEEAAAGLR